VNLDEIGPHWQGVLPDSFDAAHDTVRKECLWGTLLAGGAGVEWYFGYRYPYTDLTCEDFRSRHNWWKQSTVATQFMSRFPLESMKNANELVNIPEAYCMASPGEIYVVYLPSESPDCRLKLDDNKTFSVKWFNPREGGELINGTVSTVQGTGNVILGKPPVDSEKDWVAVVR